MRLIDDAYALVVDAVLGLGVRPAEAGGPCARALATLKRLSIPLVSLDVPSGTLPTVIDLPIHPRVSPSAPPPTTSSLFFPPNSFNLTFRACPHLFHARPKVGDDTSGCPKEPSVPSVLVPHPMG